MWIRLARALVLLVLPLVVVAGCGPTSSAPASAPATASVSADPPDPPSSAADAAPVDGTCPTTPTTSFAKTKFALHAGLAFGAFHRYLWKPYRAGTFGKGASGRVTAFVKAGLAALFVKREVRLASEDVKADPALCHAIAAPLASIGNGVQGAVDRLKGGDASGVDGINTAISSTESASGRDGAPITEDENGDLTSTPH